MYSEKPSNAYKYVCGCNAREKTTRDKKKSEVESILRKKTAFYRSGCRLVVYSLLFATEKEKRQAAKCCNVVWDYF